MTLRHLDLFSGIGGFSLGLEATGGFETVAFCDIEEFPRKVLQKHWPHVKQYTDIKELNYEQLKADGLVPIDIITGGYPCQPFSVAGRKKGEKDPRHLWPEYFRLVKELRPTWVIGENVGGHIKLGLDTVISDLESEGYTVRPFSISASSIGANHQRVWIVAYSERNGLASSEERRSIEETISRKSKGKNNTLNAEGTGSISETKSDVENTRRSLRPGSEFRGENENEIGQGNANISKRSSETSEFDVANTEGKQHREQEGKNNSRGETIERRNTEVRSESTGRSNDVANTESEGLQGREINSTIESGNSESSDSRSISSDVANSESSSRHVDETNRKHGETETQEILGNGSGLSRAQGQDVADTISEREQSGETRGQDAEDVRQSPGSPWQGWWDTEPDVGRVAHGISARTHRLKSLGNSLIPAIPFHIGTVILEVMKNGRNDTDDTID